MFTDLAFRHRLLTRAATTSAEAAAARAEVERLEHRLRDFRRAAASDDSIDPANFTEVIRELEGQIRAATVRADAIALPASLRQVVVELEPGERRVEPLASLSEEERAQVVQGIDLFSRWRRLPTAGRRAVVRDLLDIRLLPVGRGQRVPIEQRLTVRVR